MVVNDVIECECVADTIPIQMLIDSFLNSKWIRITDLNFYMTVQ
jgi:hypothetical protein